MFWNHSQINWEEEVKKISRHSNYKRPFLTNFKMIANLKFLNKSSTMRLKLYIKIPTKIFSHMESEMKKKKKCL